MVKTVVIGAATERKADHGYGHVHEHVHGRSESTPCKYWFAYFLDIHVLVHLIVGGCYHVYDREIPALFRNNRSGCHCHCHLVVRANVSLWLHVR